ncbi:sigma-w pathway protein ysdB [Brevibacillus migulae]|uniref:sigma-w pathway protein ysdB n=1 Tax=Brevibacillus migulae TaxID=1644114 RepID=UPI00106F0026|nr:sigma-w pathway protein ysdB [Brevibacillus migulae]
MVLILRFLFFAAILGLIIFSIRYWVHPKRKLESAHEKKRTFLLDDRHDVRKNFLLTYKGVMFEGEKHLGMTDDAFSITRIFIWVRDPAKLNGLEKEDFFECEMLIHQYYPRAKIEWKSPIRELLSRP